MTNPSSAHLLLPILPKNLPQPSKLIPTPPPTQTPCLEGESAKVRLKKVKVKKSERESESVDQGSHEPAWQRSQPWTHSRISEGPHSSGPITNFEKLKLKLKLKIGSLG